MGWFESNVSFNVCKYGSGFKKRKFEAYFKVKVPIIFAVRRERRRPQTLKFSTPPVSSRIIQHSRTPQRGFTYHDHQVAA
jgi:hypothetical protein